MSSGFCIFEASTKRNQALGNGRTGSAVPHLASLMITPLWPPGRRMLEVLGIDALNSAREFKECYHVPATGTTLPDVREGDTLTVDGRDYPVHYVAEWLDWDIPCLLLIVQEVKRAE